MNQFVGIMLIAPLLTVAQLASGQTVTLKGSDSMHTALVDVISVAGLSAEISYAGGGSSAGEKALVAREQGLAPMSRPFKADAIAQARAAGVEPLAHIIGLDGVGIFVNATNGLSSITFDQLRRIFGCEITRWDQIGGSRQGPIIAYRRNDQSGTTDTFKTFVGLMGFGSCVKMVNESSDIADMTSQDPQAIGFSGLSATTAQNKTLAVAVEKTDTPIKPTIDTIRAKTYPLSRELFIYEATGSHTASGPEIELLNHILNRSIMDPIMTKHDFVTLQ